MYHADLGRFMQIDPIGYADQMNLYAYVGNDPINLTDPTGTQGFCDFCVPPPFDPENPQAAIDRMENDSGIMLVRNVGVPTVLALGGGGVGSFAARGFAGIASACTGACIPTAIGGTAAFGIEGFNQVDSGQFNGLRLLQSTAVGASAGFGTTFGGNSILLQSVIGFDAALATNLAFELSELGIGSAIENRPITGEDVFMATVDSVVVGGNAAIGAFGGGAITGRFANSTRFGVRGKVNGLGTALGAGSGEIIGAGTVLLEDQIFN